MPLGFTPTTLIKYVQYLSCQLNRSKPQEELLAKLAPRLSNLEWESGMTCMSPDIARPVRLDPGLGGLLRQNNKVMTKGRSSG